MRNLIRLSHPLHLLLAALTYFLGASIANYLGRPFRADAFWFGLIAVLLAQASMNLLAEVFRPGNEAIVQGQSRRDRSRCPDPRRDRRESRCRDRPTSRHRRCGHRRRPRAR